MVRVELAALVQKVQAQVVAVHRAEEVALVLVPVGKVEAEIPKAAQEAGSTLPIRAVV